jgi:hypothetical protein
MGFCTFDEDMFDDYNKREKFCFNPGGASYEIL